MRAKKSWREKLADDKDFPKVLAIDESKTLRWGRGTFVIPAPREVDALMRAVPKGKLTTIDQMRRSLAQRHGATIACPVTTGIFAWIAAHAAAEAAADGRSRITPYWRTLKTKGEINPKYPGGIDEAKRRLTAEGHIIEQRGKRFFVADFERKLAGESGFRAACLDQGNKSTWLATAGVSATAWRATARYSASMSNPIKRWTPQALAARAACPMPTNGSIMVISSGRPWSFTHISASATGKVAGCGL